MANIINNGPAKSLAYYPVTGTDIDDTGANLKWDPATNQVTLFGRLQVYKNVASTNDTSLSLVHYGSNFVPVYISRSLGTTTNPAKVAVGNALGGISFAGRANTTFRTGAYINAVVDGAVNDNSMPSKIVFGTHNGSTLAVRAELSKLGELKVNTIKDYSGGILTLNPATKLDLGAASKISISGGSAGQVLTFSSNGVLEWLTLGTLPIANLGSGLALDVDGKLYVTATSSNGNFNSIATTNFTTENISFNGTGPVVFSSAYDMNFNASGLITFLSLPVLPKRTKVQLSNPSINAFTTGSIAICTDATGGSKPVWFNGESWVDFLNGSI